MSMKRKIAALHYEHPTWTPRQLAVALNCSPSLVRHARAICGLPIPYGKDGYPGPAPRRWNLSCGLLSVGA